MKKTTISALAVLLLSLWLTCALALETDAPQLQRLKHTVVSPSSEQVVLQLNGSYSPKVFTLKDETPRIVFDFPGVTHGREVKGVTTTNGAIVKRIRVGMQTQDSPKTRIVFDVATLKGVTYSQQFDDRTSTLTIRFTGPTRAVAADKKTDKTITPAAKSAEPEPPSVPDRQQNAIGKESGPPSEAKPEAKPDPPGTNTPPQTAGTGDKAAEKQPLPAAASLPPQPAPVAEAKPEGKPEVKPEPAPVEAKAGTPGTNTPPQAAGTGDKAAEYKAPAPVAAPPLQPAPVVEVKPEVKPEPAPVETKTGTPGTNTPPQAAGTGDKAAEKKAPAPVAAPPLQPAPVAEIKPEVKPEVKPEIKPEPAPVEAKAGTPGKLTPPQAVSAVDKSAEQQQPTESAAAKAVAAKAATTKPALLTGPESGPQLESVKFDGTSPKGEMVLFKLNDFYPPVIHGVEEGVPRVICDFNNTQLVYAGKNLIKTNGKFVKLIRITRNKKPERVRVVLDLEPNQSYDLQQVFFKEDNLFVIIVNTVKK